MMLTSCTEHSAAAWITDADLPWQQLVTFGPSSFPAYARLRFLPDPQYIGQSEDTAEVGDDRLSETEQLRVVMIELSTHSRTPDDFYFSFWDGCWGSPFSGPKVDVPNRSYFLFRGNVSELGEWNIAGRKKHALGPEEPIPALIWPADHAWCVANDVDPHWAGIGARLEAIHQLMADPRLDVVLADPTRPQPTYR
ncbi:hypothetical protein [Arthrobacter sp. HLT1-20]